MTIDQEPLDKHIINFGKNAKEAFENQENWHSCSPDIPPCCVCKKLIHDFPFRLFNITKDIELDFHFKCTGVEYFTEEEENRDIGFIQCEFCEQFHECNLIDEDQKKKLEYKIKD